MRLSLAWAIQRACNSSIARASPMPNRPSTMGRSRDRRSSPNDRAAALTPCGAMRSRRRPARARRRPARRRRRRKTTRQGVGLRRRRRRRCCPVPPTPARALDGPPACRERAWRQRVLHAPSAVALPSAPRWRGCPRRDRSARNASADYRHRFAFPSGRQEGRATAAARLDSGCTSRYTSRRGRLAGVSGRMSTHRCVAAPSEARQVDSSTGGSHAVRHQKPVRLARARLASTLSAQELTGTLKRSRKQARCIGHRDSSIPFSYYDEESEGRRLRDGHLHESRRRGQKAAQHAEPEGGAERSPRQRGSR